MSHDSRLSLEQKLLPSEGGDIDHDDLNIFETSRYPKYRRSAFSGYCGPSLRRFRLLGIFFSVILLTTFFTGTWLLRKDLNVLERLRHNVLNTQSATVRYTKPEDSRVIAVIFYGRRFRVSILDCYLKQNLVSNGGWLDEVIWIANTENTEDLVYLDQLLVTSDSYRRVDNTERGDGGYAEAWRAVLEPNNIYVKLDDDVVYLSQDAIPLMVQLKVDRPDALLISANMINSPEFNWLHYRAGAIYPYLPELTPAVPELSTAENGFWRASELPQWFGPTDWTSPDAHNEDFEKIFAKPHKHAEAENEEEEQVIVPRHRWLPLPHITDLSRTPIAQAEYDPSGKGWNTWALPAQQHYSLLQNIEQDTTNKYYLTHGVGQDTDATWDTTGHRISINCMVIHGKDILDNIDEMPGDDEQYLSVTLPEKLNRRVLVHTQALASHYRFRAQPGVDKTDIFSRYHAYASEMVCQGTMVRPEGTVDILGDV